MKILKIKKNGKIFLKEQDDDTARVKSIKSLKEYLACEVEFENGLTFGTFFKLILKEKEFFDIIFAQELNGKKLKDFEDKFDEEPEVYKEEYTLDYLEISKIFELFSFEKGSTIDLFAVFIGIGKTDDGFDVFIPLSFCSISELKDKEIVLNKLVEVYKDSPASEEGEDNDESDEEEMNDEYEQQEDDDMLPFFEAATRITLYEAIQSILYELSYYKNDKERIKTRKNQNNQHMDKNKIEILELQLKKHIESEEYEKAALVKRELDKLKTVNGLNKTK